MNNGEELKKNLIVCAAILVPTLIFLIVWFGSALVMLFDSTTIAKDKGVIFFFLILGVLAIKKISLSLLKARRLYLLENNSVKTNV